MAKKLISFRKPKLRITPSGPHITRPSARIGGKVGINVSKRGVSASARTGLGTISTGKLGATRTKRRTSKSCLGTMLGVLFLIVIGSVSASAVAGPLDPIPIDVSWLVHLPLVARSEPRPTPPPPTLTPIPTEPPAVCACSANLYNCSNFPTHAKAQACYVYCIAQGAGDIHQLDADHDGIACESLP